MRKESALFRSFLIIVVIGFSVFIIPGFIGEQASASPIVNTDIWISRPKGYTQNGFVIGTDLLTPTYSYDQSNTTSAGFNYVRCAANSYYEVGSSTAMITKLFQIPDVRFAPLPYIAQVDIVMTWEAGSNAKGATYTIAYAVAGGSWNTLTSGGVAVKSKSTDILGSFTSKPAGGAWTWTDISKLVVRITATGGAKADAWLYDYEVWLNVVVKSSPRIFVDIPSVVNGNLTDHTKTVGTTFTVNIKIENISCLFGSEFRLWFDPELLSANPAWAYGDLYPTATFLFQNYIDNDRGLVWIADTRNTGEPPVLGSGTYVTVTFTVKGIGLTTLNLYATVLASHVPAEIPHDETDGYFRNILPPYGATMKVIAPAGTQTSPFSVDINITKGAGQSGAFNVFSWEFNITYDNTLIQATLVIQGAYLPSKGTTTFSQTIDHANGWVWANSTFTGAEAGPYGNGTLASINFNILGTGTSALNFVATKNRATGYDYGMALIGMGDGTPDPKMPNPPPGTDPKFNIPITTVDGSVTVSIGVPEFPLGAAAEIALIPVIIFVWFKARRRRTLKTQNSP